MRFTTVIACMSAPRLLLLWPLLLLLIAGFFDVGSAHEPSPRSILQSDEAQLLESGINIPAAIAVPSGYTLQLTLQAVGQQHYAFNGTDWPLYNATADLYVGTSTYSVLAGRHFYLAQPDASGGQPSWETDNMTVISRVTAKTLASVTVDQDSIKWSLLQATSYSGSKEPLGDVSYVQRLQTLYGLPPSSNSTTGAAVGDTSASAYSAIYAFYVKNDA